MNDLTILYYTANTIPDIPGQRIRDYLQKIIQNKYPIISVSQKPINLGKNICVGQIGRSKYNEYKQILIGAREAKTKYIATAEDDTLYSADHFTFRPADDYFYYETNMWLAREEYFWRMENVNARFGMWGCMARKDILVKNLTQRYSLFPTDPLPKSDKNNSKYRSLRWGEPGTHDEQFGMENKRKLFTSKEPTITFIYKQSMGGRHFLGRYGNSNPENTAKKIKKHGESKKLWKTYWID